MRTKKQQKNLWNDLADKDAESYIYSESDTDFRESGKRDVADLITSDLFFADTKDKSILEIGCGTGRMTEFIADNFQSVYAVDISEKMVAIGMERLWKKSNIVWSVNDGVNLPSVRVDFVFSYIVFQHCSKEIVEANFKEIKKVLKKGGIAKVQVRGRVIRQDKWYSGDWFTHDEIKRLVKHYGLEPIKLWHDPKEERYLWIWVQNL